MLCTLGTPLPPERECDAAVVGARNPVAATTRWMQKIVQRIRVEIMVMPDKIDLGQ